MYTVAVMAALTYPSQCLPDELLQAKIKVERKFRINIFHSDFLGSEFSCIKIA